MFVRKSLAGAIAAAIAGSAIALTAGPASAVEADDTTFTPVAADLIGVGSDTSQHAVKLFADAWNNSGKAPVKLATFAATGGGNITLPSGAIPRPNGSGAGKALLYGTANNPDIDFARSSSANSPAETQAGLQAFPFALDTLMMAVSGSVASHAPAALTPTQIVDIYKGTTTNWSQIGGTAGVIAPKIPQAGSGTRSFFEAQLKAANNGVAVTLGANVSEVQEHDDTAIKSDPNAVAPFSKGRAGLLGTTLRLETGFSADRALYNVVRGTDLANPIVQRAFGEDGALCSTDVRPLIEAAGFKQLATAANGGVCGQATQNTVSNFTLNEQVATTTKLAATSPNAKSVKLVATVSGSTSPSGTVDFFEGEDEVASDVPLVSGQATANLAGVAVGGHTYTAVFEPGAATFDPSQDDATVSVKTSAKVTESFPATVKKGAAAKGAVIVVGSGATATGKVTIMKGNKVLKTATLKGGKASFTLPKLTKGANNLKAVYAGNAHVAGATKSFTIKQK
jgi:ABC-type phosphate transport system substrate-binding protein